MQKIEPSKLLNKILNEPVKNSAVILSDDCIFQKCAEDALCLQNNKKPRIFQGINAVSEYSNEVRQNNLFEPPSDAIVILEPNFSNKKKETITTYGNIVFVFGKTTLRHVITEKFFPNSHTYICYPPNETERQTCAEILATFYGNFNTRQFEQNSCSNTEIKSQAEKSLLHYNGNLYQCALHFERMTKSGLQFDDAKLDDTFVSGFDIISTLLENNLQLLDFRLQQHMNSGEDGTSIFGTIVYFFKQLAQVYAELEKTNNTDVAMRNAKIPYPAQDNIKKALAKIPYKKVEQFFSICAKLEIKLREGKNSHQILFFELSRLIVC